MLLAVLFTRGPFRRPLFYRRQDNGHLLPPCLSGAHAALPERRVFFLRRRGPGGGISAMPALPARVRPRSRGVAGHVGCRVARVGPYRTGRAGPGRGGGTGQSERTGACRERRGKLGWGSVGAAS